MVDRCCDASLSIAMIASSRHPIAQPFAGGLEAHVWHLTRALVEAGHRVTLFAGPGSDTELRTVLLNTVPFEPSARARADISMPPTTVLREHHAYLSLMLDLIDDPDAFDVVHNHSLHHLPIAMAPALRIPMLTTLHTPPTPWLESALSITPDTACVAVSDHTAQSWEPITGPVPVIGNGIRHENWPLGAGGDEWVWFGRMVPEKGAHLAIAAARRAGRRLRLAGPISDHDYYTARVAPQLDDDIRYVGHLDQDQLACLVGSCAVALITPVWDEPYGLVVAESMMCGTPVAAFARGGIPEIVGDAGILVASDDPDALAAGACAAEHLDRAAVRAHAMRNCSESAMVERYQRRYLDLMGRPVMAS